MSHDNFLQPKFNIDTQPLLDFDDLTSMNLRQSSSILTHGESLHSPCNLICPVPWTIRHSKRSVVCHSRKKPIPDFHQERKHAEEPTGQFHPKPCSVRDPYCPDQKPHLLPVPRIIRRRWVDCFRELVGSDNVLRPATIEDGSRGENRCNNYRSVLEAAAHMTASQEPVSTHLQARE